MCGLKSEYQSECLLNLDYAVSAYGYNSADLYVLGDKGNNTFVLVFSGSGSKMSDVADFASLLQNGIVTYKGEGTYGHEFYCSDKK